MKCHMSHVTRHTPRVARDGPRNGTIASCFLSPSTHTMQARCRTTAHCSRHETAILTIHAGAGIDRPRWRCYQPPLLALLPTVHVATASERPPALTLSTECARSRYYRRSTLAVLETSHVAAATDRSRCRCYPPNI